MAHVWRKLRLLVWKNFILQIRRPIGSVVEVLLPVAFLALLVFARKMIDREEECFTVQDSYDLKFSDNAIQKYLTTINQSDLFENNKLNSSITSLKLAYYPVTTHTRSIIGSATNSIKNLDMVETDLNGTAFSSSGDVVEEVKENYAEYIGAVIFNNYDDSSGFPKEIDYSIRFLHTMGREDRSSWYTKWVYPFFENVGPRTGSYYDNAFIHIQHGIDQAIIRKQSNLIGASTADTAQQYPYPDYLKDSFISVVEGTMPLVFVLAFMYSAVSIIKELVAEKQARLKESMKMMGLANWVHWTAWFIKSFLFLLITIILCVALIKGGNIFEFTNAGIIIVFLLLYVIASIFTLFFVSILFSNAIRAMLFGAVLWIGSLAPYLSIADPEKFDSMAKSAMAGVCLLPNSCLGIMIRIIAKRETTRVGVTWDNFNKGTSVAGEDFTIGEAFGMLIIDCFVYAILLWYIENVMPGEYGIPRPLYFPFLPSYWCGTGREVHTSSVEDLKMNEIEKTSNYEDEPEGMQVGVSINKLVKVFKGAASSKVAVDGLSLNIYKGQITALLGHNGAGKTTTMSILTGLFPATSGTATINGKNTVTEMDSIRASLGLCPQHNVLFDRLTVKEHLEFFTALKGIPNSVAKPEIMQMIKDIELVEKVDSRSATLSGGMKRKLCCAIALIGGSETVFLDEPTSGMDPYARRATWDLLQKYRENKTIILTTHFMDEADYLGDRIAIMSEGQLKCCGSALFLKKRYGVGYHMTLVKDTNFNENKTLGLVSEMIPTSKLTSNVGAEVGYILESESSKQFKPLFQCLEEKQQEFGISSFGVSVTTLEEVFLKVGENAEVEANELNGHVNGEKEHLHMADRSESRLDPDHMLSGMALKISQFKAMFMKRLLHSMREKKALITQIILPLLLVLCGLLLAMSTGSQEEDPKLEMSVKMLKDKSDQLYGYHVDFRPNSYKKDADLYNQMSKSYYDSVSVTFSDKTADVARIQHNNTGANINVLFGKGSYSGVVSAEKTECCNYKYLVLNEQCRTAFSSLAEVKRICGETPSNFGYKSCLPCSEKRSSDCKSVYTPYVSQLYEASQLTHPEFQEYIMEEAANDVSTYFKERVVAMAAHLSLTNETIHKVWYSNQGLHTLPSALSASSNILLRYYTNSTGYKITASNHPLPRNTIEKTVKTQQNTDVFFLIIFIAMAASFVAASFVTFIVTEKTSKAKHIQFVSGVDSVVYWSATFCWDFINYLVPGTLIFILICAFDLDYFKHDLGAVCLSLIMFGLSVLPFVYLLSFAFTSAVIAYAVIALLLMIISLAMIIAVFIVNLLNEDDIFVIMHHIFLLFPTYAFPQALFDITMNYNNRKTCLSSARAQLTCVSRGTEYVDNVVTWSRPGIGVHCFYMFMEFVVYSLLVFLIEEGFFIRYVIGRPVTNAFVAKEGEDSDVQQERQKVFDLTEDEIADKSLVVKDLTKVYRTTGMTAVDHLNFAIPKAECFGLLGVNGAGKTTTFGMLTGELGISDGTAYMYGYNIQTNIKQVQQRLGYCPQFDALVETLTGREMLRMFARLRGIPSYMIEEVVKSVVDQLNLANWADKLCGTYSGGNKRKLSTAMALVGDPPIVFLDEPTSGMDPTSRRFLWNTLSALLNSGRSIVLTSHSMEECEALCTRLVIMVNGQLKCIGSIQHLKSRFGQGYTVMMKISSQPPQQQNGHTNPGYDSTIYDGAQPSNNQLAPPPGSLAKSSSMQNLALATNTVKEFMNKHFEGAYLIEERQGLLQYQIINNELRWSQMFGTLEENASSLGIIDYSVSQTSLEQVFINFAKFQHAEERIVNKGCCSCACF